MNVRLYLDEDAIDHALIQALRFRGADLLATPEADMMGREDTEQLDFATAAGRVLYTFNARDFCRLHGEYLAQGKSHSGIVVGRQDYSIGDQTRGLMQLIARRSAEQMVNHLEYLGAWLSARNAAG
jgi:hypothetical protein